MIRRLSNIRPKNKHNQQRFWQGKGLYIGLLMFVVLVAVYLAWFFANHHKETSPTIYTPTKEANQNRYFAAKQLLGDKALVLQGQSGREELSALFQQKDVKQTAIIIYQISGSQKNDLDAMVAWIRRGGHLIVANQHSLDNSKTNTSDHQSEQNPLLLKLGIDYQDYVFDELSVQKEFNYTIVPLRLPAGQTLVVKGDFGRFDSTVFRQNYPDARFFDYHWFVKNHQGKHSIKQPTISDLTASEIQQMLTAVDGEDKLFEPQNALLDVMLGQGRLTVLSTPQMLANPKNYPGLIDIDNKQSNHSYTWQLLTNTLPAGPHSYRDGIASANHAELLSYLTQEHQAVYLVPDIESTSFFALLWRYLKWSMIGLGVTIVLGVLALPKRFGASKTYQTDVSHNIFGFFAHVGRYLWASDQAMGLLDGNRQTLIQAIIAKEQIHEPSSEKIIATVAQKTGLSAGLIHDALYQEWQTQMEFLRICRSFAQLARHYH